MVLDQYIRTTRIFGEEKVLVRPALTVNIFYTLPIFELGPSIADVLDRYLAFVPKGSLTSYFGSDGIRDLSPRALTRTLKSLRSIRRTAEYEECHFGQGPDGAVGHYGFCFIGTSLRDRQEFPSKTNWLHMQFPIDFLDSVTPDHFIRFVTSVAQTAPFSSGISGNAFAYVVDGANDVEAMRAIAGMAMRLLGFDISYSGMRRFVRGSIHTVSWLNLWGLETISSLGGREVIRAALPGMEISHMDHGILVRASERPPVGDVSREPSDIEPLKRLAALTRMLRPKTNSLGSDDEGFAGRWLSRFD